MTSYSDQTKELNKAANAGRLIVKSKVNGDEFRVKPGSEVGSLWITCGSGMIYDRDAFDCIIDLTGGAK